MVDKGDLEQGLRGDVVRQREIRTFTPDHIYVSSNQVTCLFDNVPIYFLAKTALISSAALSRAAFGSIFI